MLQKHDFLIELITMTMVAKASMSMEDEPQIFNKPGTILIPCEKENGKRSFKKNSVT